MDKKNLMLSLTFFFLIIFGGSFIYSTFEGWNRLDSFYFVVVTVTTIGYGDLAPVTDIGKIFTMFFSFFGVGMAFYFMSQMSKGIFKKHFTKKVHEIKEGIEKEAEIKDEIKKEIRKLKPKTAVKKSKSRKR